MRILPLLLLTIPSAAPAQSLRAGSWDVTSTVVSIAVPGVPGFIERMVRGKSKAEHKRLGQAATVEALLSPDPKAHCRIDAQRLLDGRYDQRLSCPQKRGDALRIARSGTFDASGFKGQATVDVATPKGPLRIVLDQRGARTGD